MNRICSICHSDNKKIIFQQKFASLDGVITGYDVVVCKKCGFAFADNVPEQEYFDTYYRELSKYEHQETSGKPTEFEKIQFVELVKYVEKYISSYKNRIFEIGCANGGLLNELRNQKFVNVCGVDPSPLCAKNARDLYDIGVTTNTISGIDEKLVEFDFVIMVAVLEHIRDVGKSILKIKNFLSPGGRIFIEVPDVTKFGFYTSVYAPYMEFSVEHINYFSPQSLSALMSIYGFDTVSMKQVCYNTETSSEYYVIRGVFQKRETAKIINLEFDVDTIIGLMNYTMTSKSAEDYTLQIINMLVEDETPIIVWGVGSHTLRLLAISDLGKANIIAFVDSNVNYCGKKINGIQIILPEELDRDELILISTRVYQSKIVNEIKNERKLSNKIITLFRD